MITAVNKSPRGKGAMQTVYFNPTDTKDIIKAAGDAGLVSMIHYIGIAHQANPIMEDTQLAKMLDKSVTAIRDTRLKLTKAGWFKRIKTTVQGEPRIIYLIGKEAIHNTSSSIAVLPKP